MFKVGIEAPRKAGSPTQSSPPDDFRVYSSFPSTSLRRSSQTDLSINSRLSPYWLTPSLMPRPCYNLIGRPMTFKISSHAIGRSRRQLKRRPRPYQHNASAIERRKRGKSTLSKIENQRNDRNVFKSHTSSWSAGKSRNESDETWISIVSLKSRPRAAPRFNHRNTTRQSPRFKPNKTSLKSKRGSNKHLEINLLHKRCVINNNSR